MEVTVNIATQVGREHSLKQTIRSLKPQCKTIRVWCNGFEPYEWLGGMGVKGQDFGSASKFMFIRPNEIYCTCDDDIVYPTDYIKRITTAQKEHGGYVSFHGRKLSGLGKNYYSGHYYFACTKDSITREIDVPGTGVGCFNTNEFTPEDVIRPEWRNMDDVAIGYECARQGIKVTLIEHKGSWFKSTPNVSGIWQSEHLRPIRQTQLANKIYLMRNQPPKVSVVIPYLKDRGYLQQAIDSVHGQMYNGEIELILSQSNNPVGVNVNRGLKEATGKYIKFLADDDYLPPTAIHDSVKAIGEHLALCGAATNFFADGRTAHFAPQQPTLERMLTNNQIHMGSLFYDRRVFDEYGLFDESLRTAEEYDFNLMLLSKGVEFAVINKSVYFYRRHDAQKSLGKDADQTWRQQVISEIKQRYTNLKQ